MNNAMFALIRAINSSSETRKTLSGVYDELMMGKSITRTETAFPDRIQSAARMILCNSRISFKARHACLELTPSTIHECTAFVVDIGQPVRREYCGGRHDESSGIRCGALLTKSGDVIGVVSPEISDEYRMSSAVARALFPSRRLGTMGPLRRRQSAELVKELRDMAKAAAVYDILSADLPDRN